MSSWEDSRGARRPRQRVAAAAMLARTAGRNHRHDRVVEQRGRDQDNQLELEFRRICDGQNCTGHKMTEFEIVFADKRTSSTDLQLADLTARPIGLHVLNPEQSNRAWTVIEPKLDKDFSGRYKGWGLKTFP